MNSISSHDKVRIEMMFEDPNYKDGIPVEWSSILRRDETYHPGLLIKIEGGYGITSKDEFSVYLGEVSLDGTDAVPMYMEPSIRWRLKEDDATSTN